MGQSENPFDSSDMSLSLGFLFEAQHMRPTAEWQQSQCETASQRELSEQLRGQRNKSFFKKASYKGCRANFHLLHQSCIPQLAVSPLLTRFTANLFTCFFWCSWLGVGGDCSVTTKKKPCLSNWIIQFEEEVGGQIFSKDQNEIMSWPITFERTNESLMSPMFIFISWTSWRRKKTEYGTICLQPPVKITR